MTAMKKLGTPLLVFAALCAVCSIVSDEVMRVNARAAEGVRAAIALAEMGDTAAAGESLKGVNDAWQKKRPFLEAFLHHETIEHAEEGFAAAQRALDISPEVFLMAAEKLAVTLKTLAEGDAAGMGNVF